MSLYFTTTCDADCILGAASIGIVGSLGMCCLCTFFVKAVLEHYRPPQEQEDYTGLEV